MYGGIATRLVEFPRKILLYYILKMDTPMMATPMEMKKPERSAAVDIVTTMIRDIFWKICDVDGIDKQQNMLMQLFKFLGGVKTLDECAQKLTALALSADKQEVVQDAKDEAEQVASV